MPCKTELLLLLLLLLLLQAPCCSALIYQAEPLNVTIKYFSSARMDIALLMPLALKLQLNSSTKVAINHDSVIKQLMHRLKGRRELIQRLFYRGSGSQGFVLSDASKFRIEDDRLILFYYVGFVGTSDMPVLRNQLAKHCKALSTSTQSGMSPTCMHYDKFTSTFVSNLSLLSKFRILAPGTANFTERFTEFQPGGQGFVSADFSAEHDIFHLLCKVFLHCRSELCNISRITMDSELKTLPAWMMVEDFLAPNASNSSESFTQAELSSSNIFPNGSDFAANFVVYRSWCMKGAAVSSRLSSWLLLASLVWMPMLTNL